MTERELPMLAGIAAFFRWLEELANILNGPVLLMGMFIALVDLLTDGALTLDAPVLLFIWAGAQAIGIDVQTLGCFARVRHARGWQLAGWLTLGIVLGFAGWQAAYVYSIQHSEHITEAAALAQLGFSPALWLGWRAFLAMFLIALSGLTRYAAPKGSTIIEERTKLERELELEPLRAQVRMRKALGWRNVAATIAAKPVAQMSPEIPPTGPGTPGAASRPATDTPLTSPEQSSGQAIRLVPARLSPAQQRLTQKRLQMIALRGSAFGVLDAQPDLSRKRLRAFLHCQQSTADALYNEWQESRVREEVAQ